MSEQQQNPPASWVTTDGLIQIAQGGIFVFVNYQGRKTNHLYLAPKHEPIVCCECEAEIPQDDGDALLAHIWTHAPKRLLAKRDRLARVAAQEAR